MILPVLLAAAQVVTPPPVTVIPPAPVAAPTDWSALPDLRFLKSWQSLPDLSRFVRDETAAGRCKAAVRSNDGGYTLTVPLIVRVDARGDVHEIIPRAIDCPTVEQYASGLVSRMARGNVPAAAGWFRTSVVFAWKA